jgi:hypothetical protein
MGYRSYVGRAAFATCFPILYPFTATSTDNASRVGDTSAAALLADLLTDLLADQGAMAVV